MFAHIIVDWELSVVMFVNNLWSVDIWSVEWFRSNIRVLCEFFLNTESEQGVCSIYSTVVYTQFERIEYK